MEKGLWSYQIVWKFNGFKDGVVVPSRCLGCEWRVWSKILIFRPQLKTVDLNIFYVSSIKVLKCLGVMAQGREEDYEPRNKGSMTEVERGVTQRG